MTKDLPDELLYGRAGYLWACLFINKHVGNGTISSTEMVRKIVIFLLLFRHFGQCLDALN